MLHPSFFRPFLNPHTHKKRICIGPLLSTDQPLFHIELLPDFHLQLTFSLPLLLFPLTLSISLLHFHLLLLLPLLLRFRPYSQPGAKILTEMSSYHLLAHVITRKLRFPMLYQLSQSYFSVPRRKTIWFHPKLLPISFAMSQYARRTHTIWRVCHRCCCIKCIFIWRRHDTVGFLPRLYDIIVAVVDKGGEMVNREFPPSSSLSILAQTTIFDLV